MPNDIVTLSAEEYQALLAERDALRGELRLAKAERDLAEERLRAYKHELFGASSEARATDQLGLFNEAEALGTPDGQLKLPHLWSRKFPHPVKQD